MKRVLVGGAVLAVGVAGVGVGSAAQGYKVTGGGQIIAEEAKGPGDTIAFNARSIQGAGATSEDGDDVAVGQLQYNGRLSDPAIKFHGTVQCLQVEGNTARIAGTKTNPDGTAGFFRLVINDVDNNGPQSGTEMLLFNPNATDANCDQMDGDDVLSQLGRGNVQIHEPKDQA